MLRRYDGVDARPDVPRVSTRCPWLRDLPLNRLLPVAVLSALGAAGGGFVAAWATAPSYIHYTWWPRGRPWSEETWSPESGEQFDPAAAYASRVGTEPDHATWDDRVMHTTATAGDGKHYVKAERRLRWSDSSTPLTYAGLVLGALLGWFAAAVWWSLGSRRRLSDSAPTAANR